MGGASCSIVVGASGGIVVGASCGIGGASCGIPGATCGTAGTPCVTAWAISAVGTSCERGMLTGTGSFSNVTVESG